MLGDHTVGTDLKLRHCTFLNVHYVKLSIFFKLKNINVNIRNERERKKTHRKISEGLLPNLPLSHLLIVIDN